MMKCQRDVKECHAVACTVKKGTIYRSFSVVLIENMGRFRIDWSCNERKEPIGPDEQMLESYRIGNFCQKDMADCFTMKEVEILKTYLWRTYSWGLGHSKYTQPIVGNILAMNRVGEFSIVSPKKELRYVELSSQGGYDLPFEVRGYGHRIL
jgi:hypothetical protein